MDRAEPRAAQVTTRMATGGKVPDELVLGFGEPLPAGKATLVLEYEAPFDDELAGLYRAKDGDAWYVFSQFEATDARRAFPCFDEPAFKVPFDISLVVPSDLKAVTNVPETMREAVPPNRTRVRFARTKPLPTYLIALAVGDLVITDGARDSRPPVRLITTKKAANPALSKLALDTTGELVDRLGNWFGIPYPYEKLDIVAVPALSAGAMENPGLVTFRDEILLVDAQRPVAADPRAARAQLQRPHGHGPADLARQPQLERDRHPHVRPALRRGHRQPMVHRAGAAVNGRRPRPGWSPGRGAVRATGSTRRC